MIQEIQFEWQMIYQGIAARAPLVAGTDQNWITAHTKKQIAQEFVAMFTWKQSEQKTRRLSISCLNERFWGEICVHMVTQKFVEFDVVCTPVWNVSRSEPIGADLFFFLISGRLYTDQRNAVLCALHRS